MLTGAMLGGPGEARLRLKLLGRFQLHHDGRPLRLPTRKVESLLAYLALHPQPHSRERLAALLWGDRPHTQAAASLRTALSALRRALGPAALTTDRNTVQLSPGLSLWVDVHAFQAQWEAAAVPAPGPALPLAELYTGDLLADFYDDWIIPLREQLRRLHVARLLDLTHTLRARSDYQQAIRVAQRVLESDAGNEPAHQHLIFCYLATGDRAEAIAQYQRCRAILQREFGAEPLPETTALYHWLRQAEVTAPLNAAAGAALPSNVPFPISSFVGREAELARVLAALRPDPSGGLPAARLLTLTGPGGSGKTRLANQAALALLTERAFADGVWWAALAPLAQAALAPQAVAQALGVPKPPARSVLHALIEHLRARHLLLVLDNCEHLLEASARLAESLLAACPRLQIVATSRQAFGLPGEVVLPVPPLSLPAPVGAASPEALLAAESARLFVERARAVRADLVVTAEAAGALAAICRVLDGLPLAIELAAAQTRSFSIEQLAAWLQHDSPLQVLASTSPTAPPRHRHLRATVQWSYDLLPPEEQALFRALSVFAGGWTLAAAEYVAGAGAAPVAPRLARLVDKSLVVAEYASDQARYRYLDTIREYASDQVAAHAEAGPVRRRHLSFFARLAARASAAQYGPREFEALKELDADLENVRAALRTGCDLPDQAAPALELACSLLRFWTVRGHWREGRDWLEALLPRVGPAPSLLRARACNALGLLAWRQRQVAPARAAYHQTLEIARALGPTAGSEHAHALRGLGLLDYAEGHLEAAQQMFEAALALFRQQGDETGLGFALVGLGEVARTQGRYDEAADYYAQHLALRRAQGSTLNASLGLHNSGQVALARGEVEQARALLAESLSLTYHYRNQVGMSDTLAGLAAAEAAAGNHARAARWFAAAQAGLRALGTQLDPSDQLVFNHYLAQTRRALPADQFAAAWAAGLALAEAGSEAAVREALEASGLAPS